MSSRARGQEGMELSEGYGKDSRKNWRTGNAQDHVEPGKEGNGSGTRNRTLVETNIDGMTQSADPVGWTNLLSRNRKKGKGKGRGGKERGKGGGGERKGNGGKPKWRRGGMKVLLFSSQKRGG